MSKETVPEGSESARDRWRGGRRRPLAPTFTAGQVHRIGWLVVVLVLLAAWLIWRPASATAMHALPHGAGHSTVRGGNP